jgi:hypothetical protein
MKTKTVVGLLLLLFLGSAAGQSIEVQFVDGTLEVRQGTLWNELFIGDRLSDDAILRLGPNSSAELAGDGNVIALHNPGLYRLGELLSTSHEVATWDMSSVVGLKLGALGGRVSRPEDQAAQMGVRGASQDDTRLTWMDDEAAQLRRDALELMDKGDYVQAHGMLLEAIDFALDEEEAAEYAFYAAYAADRMGDRRETVRLLSGLQVKPEADFYDDYALLAARVRIESLAFSEGLRIVDQYLAERPEGRSAQSMLLLASFAHKGLGDERSSRTALETARKMDPESEQGQAATRLLR